MNDLSWIYIITNPSFPKYVKIGWTRHNPHKRIAEIDSTGVPTPFDLNYVACVDDAGKLEKLTHKFLDNYRVRSSREFFEISARLAREAIRTTAMDSGIDFYFEKNYIDNDLSTPETTISINFNRPADEKYTSLSEGIYGQLGDIAFPKEDTEISSAVDPATMNIFEDGGEPVEELCSHYKSSISMALNDSDIPIGMNALLELVRWIESVPDVCDFFTDEELVFYKKKLFKNAGINEYLIDPNTTDQLIKNFINLVTDELSVGRLFDWLKLFNIPNIQQKRVARHYISQGKSTRIKLCAANYLHETGSSNAEAFIAYTSELKIEKIPILGNGTYISSNLVVNEAFLRMCDIIVSSGHHEYDDSLRRLLEYLYSSQSCFERKYPGFREVMYCYFENRDFKEHMPLSKYYS